MKKYILLYLLIPMAAFAQESPANGLTGRVDSLTLEQCIQTALKYNPQIRVSEGGFESAQSDLKLTRSALFPQISGDAGVTRNGGTFLLGNIVRNGSFSSYTAGLQAQQLIFDFGKTYSRLSASADLVRASGQDLKATKQDIIVNTYIAYYNYLAAVRVKQVDTETVLQAEDHLHQAQGFYKAGTVPQYDVVNAEVTVANATVNLISADNNVKLARIQLENVIGKKLPDNFELQDNLDVTHVDISMQTAIETAINNRPELLASHAQVEASKALLTSAWTANLPTVSAAGGYNWRGLEPTPLYSGWNFGVTLSLPIFQGFALDAGIDQARANLKTAEASNDLVMQALYLNVQQQEFALDEATQKIQASKKLVQQAEEALRLAVGEYNSGTGSALQTTDAQVALSNARISYIQSLYDYNVSYAELERAMGVIK
ncbi:MAG TPA: TolC family protein [Candidatus Kryptobacter bacterium]|nr:TolC family protein [Candidatus Kryptobacter bacterium]